MEQLPLVTAIVPTYNVDAYIEETLDSLLKQTYPNVQILVVDDGSTDRTIDILKDYAQKNKNIIVFYNENQGISRTRNFGIDHAQGKYITFVDGDDLVPEAAYENMVRSLEKTGSDMLSGLVRHIKSNKKTFPAGMFQVAIKDNFEKTTIREHPELVNETTVWNKMYRREFLVNQKLRFPEGKDFAEDIPFTMAAHLTARTVDIITDVVYFWRIRDRGDVSATQDRTNIDFFDQRIEMIMRARDLILADDNHDTVLPAFDYKLFDHDLSIYLGQFAYRTDSFLKPFHERIMKLMAVISPDVLNELDINKQVYYRAFLSERYDMYRKYAKRNIPVDWTNNQLVIRDADITSAFPDMLLTHALEVHHLLTDVHYDSDSDQVTVAGEYFFEPFPNMKISDSKLTAQLVNLDNGFEMPLNLVRKMRKERVKWRYVRREDVYHTTFVLRKALQAIGPGHWRIALNGQYGQAQSVVFSGHPISARRAAFRHFDDNSVLSTYYTPEWELGIRARLLTDKTEDTQCVLSVLSVQHTDNELRLLFNADGETGKQFILKTMSAMAEQKFVAGIVRDGQLSFSLPREWVEKNNGHRQTYQIENGYNTVIIDPNSLSHAVISDGIKVECKNFNKFSVLYSAGKALNVTGITLNKREIVLRGISVKNIEKFFLESKGQIQDLPIVWEERNQTLKVSLVDAQQKYLILSSNAFEMYVVVNNVIHILEYNDIESDWIIEYRKNGKRIAVWKTGMNTLRFKAHEEDNAWLDQTTKRRKFTEWVLYPLFRLLPLNSNMWVFDSYWATKYSSNEKAMYEYLEATHPEVKSYWIFKDLNVQIPGCGTKIKQFGWRYWWVMARTKYLVQNTNFPQKYVKRRGQIEIETLHGTFMKTMGFDEPDFKYANKRKQDDFATRINRWDYLVSPSRFMDRVAPQAFRYSGKILHTGFPRNDQLIKHNNPEYINSIKDKLGLPSDKEIVLYAPTYRNRGEFEFKIDLDKYVAKLSDKQILLVRLHYFIASQLDLMSYKGKVIDVSGYPAIEDLYLVSDALITDYSSVMFDYALLKRPMIFYSYDVEWYTDAKNRGTYLDYIDSIPGPLVKTNEELFAKLKDLPRLAIENTEKLAHFVAEFGTYGQDGDATKEVVEQVLNGQVDLDKQFVDKHAFSRSFWKLLQIEQPFTYWVNKFGSKLKKKTKRIVFQSFGGSQISDNPLAMYEQIKIKHPDYELIWLVDEVVYEKYKALGYPVVKNYGILSAWRVAKAKIWIINDLIPFEWVKPVDVRVIQTWHGRALRKFGDAIQQVRFDGLTRNEYINDVLKNALFWDKVLVEDEIDERQKRDAFQLNEDRLLKSISPRRKQLMTLAKELVNSKPKLLMEFSLNEEDAVRHGVYEFKLPIPTKILAKLSQTFEIYIKPDHAYQTSLLPKIDGVHDLTDVDDLAHLYKNIDVYITDYSSRLFDMVTLGKSVIRYAPDLDNVKNGRGLYESSDLQDIPLAQTPDELIGKLEVNNRVSLIRQYEGDLVDEMFDFLD